MDRVRDSFGGRFERCALVKVQCFWDRSLAAPKGRAIKAQGNALGSIQCETMRALKGRHKPIAPLQGSTTKSQGVALGWSIAPFQGCSIVPSSINMSSSISLSSCSQVSIRPHK